MSAQNQQGNASNGDISIVTNFINIITISSGANNSAPIHVRTVATSTTTINRTGQPGPNPPTPDAPEGPNDHAPDDDGDDTGSNDHEDEYGNGDQDDFDPGQFPSSPPSARCPDSDDSQVRYGELEDEMVGGRLTLPQKKKEKEKQHPKAPKPPANWPKHLKGNAAEQVEAEEVDEKADGRSKAGRKSKADQDDGDAGGGSKEGELPY